MVDRSASKMFVKMASVYGGSLATVQKKKPVIPLFDCLNRISSGLKFLVGFFLLHFGHVFQCSYFARYSI